MEKGLPRKWNTDRMKQGPVIIAIREPSVNNLLFNPFLIPIVAIVGYFGYKAIEAVSHSYTAVARHKSENELKLVLAQRGMSADEIVRVVSAGQVSAGNGLATSDDRDSEGTANPNYREYVVNAAPLPPGKSQPVARYASRTTADSPSF